MYGRRTLAQIRAWNIWTYYSERVNNILKVCREEECRVIEQQGNYKVFSREQNIRLLEATRLMSRLHELCRMYRLGKGDCVEQWSKEILDMNYFITQDY